MKTTSFEISKKLKEVGVMLDDYTYCYCAEGQLWNAGFEISPWENEDLNDYYAAYTLEDILEVLPIEISVKTKMLDITSYWLEIDYCSKCFWYSNEYCSVYQTDFEENKTLADTAARLLSKLIADKIITIEEVKYAK